MDARIKSCLEKSFRAFQDYELSLLRPADRRVRFAPVNRLTYADFRSLWRAKFGNQPDAYLRYGPELSWHVIRTYIKGTSPEEYLDPDDYQQLPAASQSVSVETYKTIWERVWRWYEEYCKERSRWDDQDLARHILDEGLAKPVHPAVFCDEAQDFTRIELELLLQINLYSQRTLTPEEVGRVCFVFAGDQFQTLNPTGFRWEGIKSVFTEKFIDGMSQGRKTRPEINYKELEYNYRSSAPIVRFSNAVQAFRAVQFDVRELRPQKPWSDVRAPFNVDYFQSSDGAFWSRFAEMKGIVVILPCMEGEEETFVRTDKFLRQNITITDGVPANAFSSIRAKGSEYQAVIVYGFGQFCRSNRLLENDQTESGDQDSLALEYFLNRLYVAVSRAKTRMIIVDEADSIRDLWSFAWGDEGIENLFSRAERLRPVWEDYVSGMREGIHDNLKDSTSVDLRDLAKTFESEGRARKDSYYMRQASQTYSAIGDSLKSAYCSALAFEYDELPVEAGKEYEDARHLSDALRMFWRSGPAGSAELSRLIVMAPELQREPEAKVRLALDSPKLGGRTKAALEMIRDRRSDPAFADRFLESNEWVRMPTALAESWLKARPDVESEYPAVAIHACLRALRSDGVSVSDVVYARICASAEQWEEAKDLFEQCNETRDAGYEAATAALLKYPSNLSFLLRRGDQAEIIREFRKSPEIKLDDDQARIIAEAFLAAGDLTSAVRVAWNQRLDAVMVRLLAENPDATRDIRSAAIHALLRGLISAGDWECVAYLLDSRGRVNDGIRNRFAALTPDDLKDVAPCLHQELARLDRELPSDGQTKVAIRKFVKFCGNALLTGNVKNSKGLAECGSAIERCAQFGDAVDFYQSVRSPPLSEEDKAFAQFRLIAVKKRQCAAMVEKSGQTGQTRQLQREVSNALARLRDGKGAYSNAELEGFPSLAPVEFPLKTSADPDDSPKADSLNPDVSPAIPVDDRHAEKSSAMPDGDRISLRGFTFEVSRTRRRLNITHDASMETANFRADENMASGEKSFVMQSDGRFFCSEWSMTIGRAMVTDGRDIVVEIPGLTLKIGIEA